MKMRRYLVMIALCLFVITVPSKAYADYSSAPRLVDNVGMLSESNEEYIVNMLTTLSENKDLDIVMFIEDEISSEYKEQYGKDYAMYYCADLFDYGGYTDNGLALLIVVNDRKWALVTEGAGDSIFNQYAQETLSKGVVEYLKENDYYQAALYYAMTAAAILEDDSIYVDEDAEYAEDYEDIEYEITFLDRVRAELMFISYRLSLINYSKLLGISLVISLIIAGIKTRIERVRLTSVIKNDLAANYVVGGSLNLRAKMDTYLYTEVDRVERSTSDDSDSSSFTSSSGDSHTGSSGDF